ncbi:NAD(P)-dependent alcohol dehydrogenase [Solwaraspora sp. WMMD1047]|uniref:NAD(P)-dependent alcohol dehydrogenase n=1 Tax=Solwaraspora sp. WMMD1047 TaxID=3016102 RepID=UPI0024170A02|nr:NAD(P)-dependent alcohol dehydrogenase [Solwaraspora sp. WMMD1047]MDG4832659.1 NAD(P)-dependent alcohol dehydrogenase [Solwaraspora sp. WMMD1047]
MKAIVQDRYGSPELLRLRDVDRPEPAADEILVRVKASSVNARDWHLLRGDPLLARLLASDFGWRAPRRPIRGSDVAGQVVAVGAAVTRFRPGDEVYADACGPDGAFAEYVCVPERQADTKPARLSFEQAAAVPLAGATALLGLRDVAGLVAGQRVLINGASGGVGTFAVQIGRAMGAEVTGVCSTRNVELVEKLGADHVVDYRRSDFVAAGPRYDVVLDLVGNRGLAELRSVLVPGGTLVLSGGGTSGEGRPTVVGPMRLSLWGMARSGFARRDRIRQLNVVPKAETLAALRGLIERGDVTPAIDRSFPLGEVPEAIRYLEHDHARAKVVITVHQD